MPCRSSLQETNLYRQCQGMVFESILQYRQGKAIGEAARQHRGLSYACATPHQEGSFMPSFSSSCGLSSSAGCTVLTVQIVTVSHTHCSLSSQTKTAIDRNKKGCLVSSLPLAKGRIGGIRYYNPGTLMNFLRALRGSRNCSSVTGIPVFGIRRNRNDIAG